MKTFPPFLAAFLFFVSYLMYGQPSVNMPGLVAPVSYPKIYLHTDREIYFQGDSLWFKAYYLDGRTQQLIPGEFSLYTDLIDTAGHSITSQVLLLENGRSSGKLEIPDSISTGTYLLRAYTDLQESLGEDAFFHKTLKVTSVQSRMDMIRSNPEDPATDLDVAFLPEGGYLLAGHQNTVAVKAVDIHGLGFPVRGEIRDDRGNVVARFENQYRGMGAFQFTPEPGKTYTASIEGHPEFSHVFDEIEEAGIKLEFTGESGDLLLFTVTTNSDSFTGKNYTIAILHRGMVLFRQGFQQKNRIFPLKIQKQALPGGINRLILLDEELRPVSERLYFSGNRTVNDISIRMDQESYLPRSEVHMELFDEEELEGMAVSNLSVAVVDAYAMQETGPDLNILSWLLVDSELKGHIESPSDLFTDDGQLASSDKLDLVMLTNGWSRYIWTSLAEKPARPEFIPWEGISIEGTVKHPVTKRPIEKGMVELRIFNINRFIGMEGPTDKDGRFSFDQIVFNDTASLFIQAWNKKGKSYVVVELDPVFPPEPGCADLYRPVEETTDLYPSKLYEQQYYSDLDLKNFALETGSILLEGVTISRKRPVSDGHFRIYAKPYNSLQVTEKDVAYRNIANYLQGRVSGVMVIGDRIIIHGMGSFRPGPPLFLLDGTPVDEDVIMSIPMIDIDLVEVLKTPAEAGIFGTRAGNGVISVLTRKGGAHFGYPNVPGSLAQQIAGYKSDKEFYSPVYTAENIQTDQPDHRLTLYWNPEVITEAGRSSLSFFTSDDPSRYRILVEGITQTGEICLGSSELTVRRE